MQSRCRPVPVLDDELCNSSGRLCFLFHSAEVLLHNRCHAGVCVPMSLKCRAMSSTFPALLKNVRYLSVRVRVSVGYLLVVVALGSPQSADGPRPLHPFDS